MRKHFRNKLVKNVCLAMAILMVAFLGCQAYMNAGTTTSHNVIIVPKEYTGDKIVSMSATYISSAEPYVNREYKFEDVSVIATLENGETREMGYVQMDENSEELTEEYVVTKNNNQLVISLNPAIYDYEVSTTADLPVLVNVEAQLLNDQKQVDNAKYTYEDFSLTAVYSNGLSYAVPIERDMIQPYKTVDGQEVQAIEYIYADNIEVPVGEVKFDKKTYLEIELSMLDVTDYARMMGYYSSSNCCNLFNIEFSSTSNANIFPGRYALNVVDYKNRNLYTVSYADQLVKVLDPDTRGLISVTQTNYTWTTEGQMFYLKGGGGCTWNGIGKIYGFKYVYDNVTLMDLQPVKIDENTYGLFNKATSEIIFTMGANENHGGAESDIHKMYEFEPKKLTGETTEITITLNPNYYGEGATATIPVNVLTIQSLDAELINTDEPYANKEYGYEDIAVTATLKNGETRQLGFVKLDENSEENVPEFLMTKSDGKINVNLNPDVFSYDVAGTLELPKLVNIEVEKLNTQKITPGAIFVPEDFKLTTVYDNGRSYVVPASNPYRLTDGTVVQPIEYIYADKIAVPVGEINFDSKTYLELDLEMLEASNYARMMGFYGGSSNCCNLFNIEFASYSSANIFPGRYALNVGDYRNRNLYTVSYADQMVKVLSPETRDLLYVTKTSYSWTTSNQMFYLKGGGDKTAYGTGKIYGFKYVYDNVTLMDLIPVKVNDETYGLYNIITSEMVFTMGANENHGSPATKGTEGNYSVSPYMISNDTTEIRFDLDSALYGEGVYTTYPVEVVTIESIKVEKTSTIPAYVGVEYDVNDFEVKIVYSDGSEEIVDSNKYTISPSVITEDTTEITVTLLSEYFGEEMTATYAITPLLAQNVYLIGSPVANKAVGVLTEDGTLSLYGAGDIKTINSNTSTPWYNKRGDIKNVVVKDSFLLTNPKNLFANLTEVVSITGLENFDMTNTTDWSSMFYYDQKLATLEGTEIWNPKALTTMNSMFLGCNSLPVVDLSSLDTTSVTNVEYMFKRGPNDNNLINYITAAYAKTQADADKLNKMVNVFYTKWVAKPKGTNFMIGRIDNQLIWKSSIKSSTTEIEIVNSIPEDLSSYAVYDLSVSSKEPVKAWIDGTKMYIGANGTITAPTSMALFFRDFTSLTKITGLDNIDMTNTTDWSSMFYNDSKLVTIEGIEAWNPKSLITMNSMFLGCNSLPVVDLSSLDTTSVTNVEYMFKRGPNDNNLINYITAAYAKTQVDADKLNKMVNVFYTKWVAKPEGSNFMIGRIDGKLIWQGSIKSSITEIEIVDSIPEDLSSYTVDDLSVSSKEPVKAWIDGTKMYIGTNGAITAPTSMALFFRDFTSLTKITGLDNIDMTNTTDWSYMFYNDSKLVTIEGTETWNPKSLTTMNSMFLGCNSLSVVDLSSLDTTSVTNVEYMFKRGPNDNNLISKLTIAYAKEKSDVEKLNSMVNMHFRSWSIKIYISFNLNGAVGTIPDSIVSPPNKTLNLPTPEASNNDLAFNGWSIYPDNYSGKMTYTTSVESPNTTLYAIWMPAEVSYYNVTLNLNYEGSNDSLIQVPQGYKIWDNLPIPARTGYDFIGWYDSLVDGNMITTTWEPIGDTTIYAYWTPTVYTITYNLNSGTISETAPTTYTIEDEDFVLEIPTRSGYRFTGWNGSGYSYRTAVIPKGSTGDKTYAANWQTAQAEGVLNDNVNFKAVLDANKNSFTSVIFEESLPENIGEYTTIDFSYNYDNSVIGWIDDNQTLHIGSSKGKVVAYNTNGLFEGISYVERVDISKLDISNITNTQAIFKNMANLRYVNMSGLDFSKVTESSWMFYNDTKLETVEWDHDFTATKNLENLFRNCNNLTTSFYVAPTVTSYANALNGVSTSSGQLTLKFEETNKALTTNIYNTKSSSSNVVLEHVDNLYTITTDGSEYGYIDIPTEAYENVTLNLYNKSEGYLVTSYVMNGELVEGCEFTMPSENVTITDIKVVAASIIETAHNYSNNMNTTIGTWNFGSAEQVNISLDYQTEWSYDYFRLINSDGTEYINPDGTTTTSVVSYGNRTRTQQEITTSVNSGKIFFHSDFSGTYWGLFAIVTPAGTDGNYYSIAVANNPGIHFNVSEESLTHAVPYKEIKLIPNETGYEVISFDLNGTTVEGNSFWMPMEDVTIDNIVLNNFLADYTTVEYAESDGSQYVDTGYIPNSNTKIEIKWLSTDTSGNQAIIGSVWNGNAMLLNIQSNIWYFHANGQRATAPSLDEPDVISYSSAASSFLVNGTTYNNSADSLSNAKTSLKIFGLETAYRAKGKLYYVNILEGNALVKSYIPAVRNEDGVAGLFDTVNKEFLVSATETALLPPSQASAETTSLFSIQNDKQIEDNTQLEDTGETEESTTTTEGEGTGENESLSPDNISPDTPDNTQSIPSEEDVPSEITTDESSLEGSTSEDETILDDTNAVDSGEDIVVVEETPESESSAPLDIPNEDPVDLSSDEAGSTEGDTVSSEE